MLKKIGFYAKAVAGGLAAGAAALSAALIDNQVSGGEWVTIIVAAVGGTGLVAWIPNARKSDLDA